MGFKKKSKDDELVNESCDDAVVLNDDNKDAILLCDSLRPYFVGFLSVCFVYSV